MLPDFPKVKRGIHKKVVSQLRAEIARQAPLTGKMFANVQHEGHQHSFETVDGKIEVQSFKEIASQFSIPASLSSLETKEQLDPRMKEVVHDLARQSEQMLFSTIDQITEETGMRFDAKGKPFHPRMYWDMVERMPVDFDEHENPRLPTIVVHPEMMRKLEDKIPEWEADPGLKRRKTSILDRKKQEWRDRESNRKLVG